MREKPLVIRTRQQTEQSVGVLLGSLAARYHLNTPVGQDRTIARRSANQRSWQFLEHSPVDRVVDRALGKYFLVSRLAEAKSRILHTNRQCKLAHGFAEQLFDAGTSVIVQKRLSISR
jgi:hypothetical protein